MELREQLKKAARTGASTLNVSLGQLKELLDEVERLRGLVKDVPFKVGDIVREVGEEEPTGKIIQIKDGRDEKCYVVELNRPYPTFNTVIYYVDEIELVERKDEAAGT